MNPPVTLYVTPGCGYCHRARALLERLGITFRSIDVSGDWDTRDWLRDVSGQGTVPQIFIGGRSIGGSDELHALHARGQLLPLVEAAAASSETDAHLRRLER